METTKNEMNAYSKNFFFRLGNYLDTQIYYYGSIQRDDYFPDKSDIDIDIFTCNIQSTLSRLQNFLNVEKYKVKNFVYKLHKTNKVVYGYKIKYEEEENKLFTEISVYEEKDKNYVLIEHNSKAILPFYISWVLIILKTFYYKLGLLPEDIYLYLKKLFMNTMIEGVDVEFVKTDLPDNED